LHDATAVNLNRLFRRTQLSGNLLVQHTSNNELHHFELARCEKIKKLSRLIFFRGLAPLVCGASQSALNALKQLVSSEWLWKKIDRASFHRPSAHRNIPVACYEDELLLAAALNQGFLKIDAIKTRHPNIDNHSRRSRVCIAR
jgi:hypothetical protein